MNSYIQAKSRGVHISLAVLLSVVLLLTVMLMTMPTVHAAEGDVDTWNTSGTCEWGIDPDGCLWIRPQNGTSGTLDWNGPNNVPWREVRNHVRTVVVKNEVNAAGDCSSMFAEMPNCVSMDLSGLDTSRVTLIRSMFYGCSSLTSLDLSGFNTSNVTDMSAMFSQCSSMTSLDLSGFNTSNVTCLNYTFMGCSQFKTVGPGSQYDLNIAGFDTSNVDSFVQTFANCENLEYANLSIFVINQGNVRTTDGPYHKSLFDGCPKFTKITVGEGFESYENKPTYSAGGTIVHRTSTWMPTPPNDTHYSGYWIAEEHANDPVLMREDEDYLTGAVLYRENAVDCMGPFIKGTTYVCDRFDYASSDFVQIRYVERGEDGDCLSWQEIAPRVTVLMPDTDNGAYSIESPSIPGMTPVEAYGIELRNGSQKDYESADVIEGVLSTEPMMFLWPSRHFRNVVVVYERGERYSIVYNANNGTGDKFQEKARVSEDYVVNSESVEYNDGAETRYVVGWNTAEDGTGAHYDLGEVIPANTYSNGGRLELFAEWGAEPVELNPSSIEVGYVTDINNIQDTTIDFWYMYFDPSTNTYHKYDMASGGEVDVGSGNYTVPMPAYDGYSPWKVYVCTNAEDYMNNGDDPIWGETALDPRTMAGKLSPMNELKVYAIAYKEVDPNVTEFNATLLVDQNASVPNATIAFTATFGSDLAAVPGTSIAVLAPTAENGVTGMPTIGTATYAPGDATVTSADGVTIGANQRAAVKPVEIDFNGVTFAQPGVFRYLITEPSSGYGLRYDTQLSDDPDAVRYQRVLDVYVNRDENDAYVIADYVFHEVPGAIENGTSNVSDKSSGFVHEYDTTSITLESRVTGNQSSIDKYFAYTITVQNPNNSVFTVSADWTNAADALNPTANPATKYDAATITAANTAEWTSNADGSLSKTIYLSNGQKVELDGIPAGATYSVTVADEDYSPSWTAGSGSGSTNTTGNRVLNAMEDVVFTLTREGVVPTGVMLSAVPGLIIMAGALIVVSTMRKRRESRAEA